MKLAKAEHVRYSSEGAQGKVKSKGKLTGSNEILLPQTRSQLVLKTPVDVGFPTMCESNVTHWQCKMGGAVMACQDTLK